MSAIDIVTREIMLNSKLFGNVLEGITDKESTARLNGKGNHLRWLAGHLTGIRYRFVKRLGGHIEEYPHTDKYVLKDVPVPPNARPLDEGIEYPSLAETLDQWNKVSALLAEAISKLKEEQLSMASSFSPPTGGNTLLDALSFLAYHEGYHLGQMGQLRVCLGHSATSFR